ncbi:MAG: SDR family oxidoreductase [Thermoprotei archaeon]
MYNLSGKVVVVTGSGRGIGRAIALRFAAEGCKVVLNARKRQNELDEGVEQARRLGAEAVGVLTDVSTQEGAGILLERALESYGRVDILVNNAGIGIFSPFVNVDDKLLEKHLATDFRSVVYTTRLFAQKMSSGGAVLNISSLAGTQPMLGLSIYGAMKAAVNTLTKYLAVELAPRIRVNAIAPGWVNTRLGRSMPELLGISMDEFAKKYTLMGKILEPEDVAEMALTIVRIESLTGQTIQMDSGESLLGFQKQQ